MAPQTTPDLDFVVDFPTLWVAIEWVERHCVVPDREDAGQPFVLGPWQAWFYANHYRVKPEARLEVNGRPATSVGASAFANRRSQLVLPQKAGKGPLTASQVCLEGVGPARFAGWATGGEKYRCRDHHCGCGWTYVYEPGEPMGVPWSTPLIQITAFSQEQTDNIYGALRPMIEKGPLHDVIPKTGESFIRLPNDGRIDTVTSSQQSRLGQRVTFVPQDEVGIWTATNKMTEVAKTQRRGLAGMGGRATETTNGWDPAENSVAQQTALAALRRPDIFRYHPLAPAHLSYRNKDERRKIHRYVYAGCPWVVLDDIEAEAAELILTDAANAERFFGNRIVAGSGAWFGESDTVTVAGKKLPLWAGTTQDILVPEGAEVCGGFDGSESEDWTGIRLETQDGHRFTPRYGPDRRPTFWDPSEWGGSIPRDEVDAAVRELGRRYRLRRMYCDPRDWQSEIGDWALALGEEVVLEWATYRIEPMFQALQRSKNDLRSGRSTHDDCPITALHVANARKAAKASQAGTERYILTKPDAHRKIDMAMADTLAHEAASDLREEGWVKKGLKRVTGRTRTS